MNANVFFKVLNHARKIHVEERAIWMAQLCDISAIGGVAEFKYYKELKNNHLETAFGKPKRKALSLKDNKTASILASAFWAGRNRG